VLFAGANVPAQIVISSGSSLIPAGICGYAGKQEKAVDESAMKSLA
jgi:hypothetical protein